MAKKRILSTVFVVAMLAVSAGQAMAQSNGEVTSGSVDLTNTPLQNESVTPFRVTPAADTGGGQWDYGTRAIIKDWSVLKQVYSNYNHLKYTHYSSCTIGTTEGHSGPTRKGNTAYSDAIGDTGAETHAYWKVDWEK
jgi:hypothetical protein